MKNKYINKKKIVYKFSPFIKFIEDFSNKYLSRKNFHNIKIQNTAMVILEIKKVKFYF